MNRVKEYLQSKSIKISLNPSAPNFFIAWEIEKIIDNPTIFEELYAVFPLDTIDNLEDYYLYFLSKKIETYAAAIYSILQDEHKKIIANAISLAQKQLAQISIGIVIKFVDAHIRDIFEDDDSYDYISVTIDFMAEYCTVFSISTWEYLAEEHGYLLLNKYDKFEKTFEHDSHLFELVFKSGSLVEIESLRLETVLSVWSHIYNKQHSSLKPIVDACYPVLYEDLVALAETATIENVMLVERKTSRMYRFLKRIRSPKANEFGRVDKRIQKLLNSSIMQTGQVFQYEIPVKEIVDRWKATKEWEIRLLSITHNHKVENGNVEMISRLCGEKQIKSGLMDMVSTNVPTDEYFTLSHQEGLSLISNILSSTIIGIICNPETLTDYLQQITTAMHFVSERINGEDEQLEKDVHYLINQIKFIADNKNNTDTVNLLCYGASMFTLSLAEKLMRLTYLALVKNDIYVPINKATFGDLLNEENKYLVDIFGKDHILCLSFFIIQTKGSKIGLNIRNALAHWNGLSSNQMDIRFFAQVLWLYTDIMNTIFWYYIKLEKNL